MLAAAEEQLDFEVWPENWPTYQLFADLQTQWRVGMGGPVGLDYCVALRLLDDQELSKEERRERFRDIRAMEAAALEEMQKRDS